MSVHLNECQCYEGSCCSWMVNCTCQCICDVLRACERRLLEGRPDLGISEKQAIANYAIYQNGYDAALAAAREAVLRLHKPWARAYMDTEVLAAIDALGEKP